MKILITVFSLIAAINLSAGDAKVKEIQFEPRSHAAYPSKLFKPWKLIKFDKKGLSTKPLTFNSKKILIKREEGKLLFDTNGDGKFDEKDGVTYKGNVASLKTAFGIEYQVHFMKNEKAKPKDAGSYYIESYTYMKSVGSSKPIYLIDSNLNGIFGEQYDGISYDPSRVEKDIMALMIHEGNTCKVSSASNGTKLIFTPYEGVTSPLKVISGKNCRAEISLYSKKGEFTLESNRTSHVIPGEYLGSIDALFPYPDKKGESLKLTCFNYKLNIQEGKSQTVNFASPFKLDFKAHWTKDSFLITDAMLTGAAGEEYRPSLKDMNNQGIIASRCFIRSGDLEKEIYTLSYG